MTLVFLVVAIAGLCQLRLRQQWGLVAMLSVVMSLTKVVMG